MGKKSRNGRKAYGRRVDLSADAYQRPDPASMDSCMVDLSGWSKLPAELRVKIYQATWEPRAVNVDYELDYGDDRRNRVPRPCRYKFTVYSPPPVTLHVNAEARAETLRHYVPFFRSQHPDESQRQVLYLNPRLDVLVMDDLLSQFHNEHSRTSENAARLFSMLSVAKEVCVTRCPRYFKFALKRIRVIDAAEPGKWFPAGLPVFTNWGLTADQSARFKNLLYLEWVTLYYPRMVHYDPAAYFPGVEECERALQGFGWDGVQRMYSLEARLVDIWKEAPGRKRKQLEDQDKRAGSVDGEEVRLWNGWEMGKEVSGGMCYYIYWPS